MGLRSSSRTTRTRARLGELHLRLGNLEAAEAEYRRALESHEKVLGPGHVATTADLLGLGNVSMRRGRLHESENYLIRALALAEGDNPENPFIPSVLNALADLRLQQARLEEAKTLIERSRSLQERLLPRGHFDLGATSAWAGEVLLAQGKPEAAEPLFREALAIAERAYDADHPDAARALHGLGIALSQAGDREEAATCLERALTIRRARLGATHPDTGETSRAIERLREQ